MQVLKPLRVVARINRGINPYLTIRKRAFNKILRNFGRKVVVNLKQIGGGEVREVKNVEAELYIAKSRKVVKGKQYNKYCIHVPAKDLKPLYKFKYILVEVIDSAR